MNLLHRISAFFLLGCLAATTAFAQEYPKVSTDANEHWYYIRFMRTGNVLEAQADGASCRTATATSGKSTQLWKIVADGNAANKKYKIIDKAGATLCLNGTDLNASRFQARTTAANTSSFQIFYSSNTDYGDGALEIAPDSTGNFGMNQVGLPKVGQEIGIWDRGDTNNALQFYSPSDMEFAYSMPETSTASNPKYYYIQFQNGNWLLSAKTNKAQCMTTSITSGKLDDMLFRITETDGRYTFISKSGKKLYKSGSNVYAASSTTSADTLFYIVNSTNSLGGYEIGTSTTGSNFFNMWGGAGSGKSIGFYDLGDGGNVVRFISSDDMIPVKGISAFTPTNRYTLWYTEPATTWMTSCLPIGNGQFGATVMGQVAIDDVQFNDKTLWSGKLGSRVAAAGPYGYYLNFGNLKIRSKNLTTVTDYVRYLDINDAVTGVNYKMDGVDYTRTYFVTNPDSCLVLRYTASEDGKINTVLTLKNQNGKKATYKVNGDGRATITFKGTISRTKDSGAATPESYYCAARVVTDGGSVSVNENGLLEVSNANSMTVYLRGLTDYDPSAAEYVSGADQLESRALAIVDAAEKKGYESLLADHKSDYQSLFNRCQLTLADAENTISTPKLITKYKSNQKNNLFLEELYFNYGRYLLISSSRGVSLPANLQGIWNNNNTPAWHSDIHSNINVQMNYWPAEPTNLSELHMPFIDYIYREAVEKPTWHQFAKDMGKVDAGWTLPTENNIYGSGTNFASTYTVANAWYCQHLWQHYAYTLDTTYLRKKAFPAMKSCVDYWFKKLRKASDGTYECPDEWSPEHGGTENATAHSQQLVWDLFNNTKKAIEVLGDDVATKTFRDSLNTYFAALDNGCHTEVNPSDGKTYLREWKYSSQFNNASFVGVNEYMNHRHISHLMGLYPCDEIGEDQNDSIFQAAKVSLIARGDGHGTGWSLGHKINLNARAYMGDHCHNLIKRALQQTWTTGTNEAAGGIYENLWDAHAPYQIDGNFGYTAGIAEMLLQSHFGKLEILPAIPTQYWTNGKVTGLKAVGNFTVDIEWKDTVATNIRIVSNAGQKCTVQYKDIDSKYIVLDANGSEVKANVDKAGQISFNTAVGGVYTIVPGSSTGIVNLSTANKGTQVKDVEYFTMSGMRVSSPANTGVYVRKTTYTDGEPTTDKYLVKK